MFRQRNLEHNSLNGTFTCFSVVLYTFEFYWLDPASKPDCHMLCLCLHLNWQDGSKSLCKGNPSSTPANSLLKIRNVQKGPQKRIAWDNELLYIPKEGITEMLRSFLDQFLSGAYNSKFVSFPFNWTITFCFCKLEITGWLPVLMQSVCDDIKSEHHSIEKSDISTFFKVARFVLVFQHEKASNDQVWNRTHEMFMLLLIMYVFMRHCRSSFVISLLVQRWCLQLPRATVT